MLINSNSGKKIIEKTKIANTPFSRFKGLMFEKKENFTYGLIFELEKEGKINSSVHMLFVFFPIDIVYLNSQKIVVDKATLNSWILNYTPKKASKYFVELPKGIGDKIKLGEKLQWT
ncbi:MAG: DUF192 domain-containing protein [archaeon]|nr:DUF192 domain-containing protein [archaeon]